MISFVLGVEHAKVLVLELICVGAWRCPLHILDALWSLFRLDRLPFSYREGRRSEATLRLMF